jgi:hypothetical protein
MSKAPSILARLAFRDWCIEAERLAYLHGAGPLPVQSCNEPAWLRIIRSAREAKK